VRAYPFLGRAVLLLAGAAGVGAACDNRRTREGPSPAADAIIARAASPEERRALERVRDEIDAGMRQKVGALDAEIEALRRENEELQRSVREP